MAEPGAQLLAQLRDVTLDDAFLASAFMVAVDRVEDLPLGDLTAAVLREVLEDMPFAAGQEQALAVDLRIAPVLIDDEATGARGLRLQGGATAHAAADRIGAGDDLADMDGLAHHIVDAGGEEGEGCSKERVSFRAMIGACDRARIVAA